MTSFDLIKLGKNLSKLELSSRWKNEGYVWDYGSNDNSNCFLFKNILNEKKKLKGKKLVAGVLNAALLCVIHDATLGNTFI